jgi:glucose dehydrogenase
VQPGAPTGADATIPAEAINTVLHPRRGEWPTYNGVLGANRHSALDQINTRNARNLQLEWVSPLNVPDLETTPIVSDSVMYVTAPDHVCALVAATGRELWCYTRSDDSSESGTRRNSGLPNRGVGLLGDRIFFATSDAHLLCLNRLTGALMWDVNVVESPGRYFATSAPLVVGDLVIGGIRFQNFDVWRAE